MNDSLPDNRTPLQSALLRMIEAELHKQEKLSPAVNFFDAHITSAQFLPALAIERGVSDWFPDDTTGARRNVTANGLLIQSKSCSRSGLSFALSTLGVQADIRKTPRPFELHINANLLDIPMDEATSFRIISRINTYKAERDIVTLDLVRSADVPLVCGVYAEIAVVSDSEPYVPEIRSDEYCSYLAVVGEVYIISDSEAAIR
ncbi:MAG: phage tail protein [Plesiomonas sp.]